MTIPERIISGDSHLEVSPERWQSYVAREFHEWVPKVVQLPDGGDAWKVPGSRVEVPLGLNFGAGLGSEGLKTRGISYRDNPAGSGDSAQRLREMDQDGIEAELLFPAVAGARSLGNRLPREAHVAVIQGYNDWLSREFTAADPKRLLGVAMLPATTAEDAADEVRRIAGMPGIRTAVLHLWPSPTRMRSSGLRWSTSIFQ
jgi:predicted TIM-barrel fold metal-dependent hydrolase